MISACSNMKYVEIGKTPANKIQPPLHVQLADCEMMTRMTILKAVMTS